MLREDDLGGLSGSKLTADNAENTRRERRDFLTANFGIDKTTVRSMRQFSALVAVKKGYSEPRQSRRESLAVAA